MLFVDLSFGYRRSTSCTHIAILIVDLVISCFGSQFNCDRDPPLFCFFIMLIISQVLVDMFHDYISTLDLVMCLEKDMVFLVFGEWYEGKRWYKEVISSEQLVEMMCKA